MRFFYAIGIFIAFLLLAKNYGPVATKNVSGLSLSKEIASNPGTFANFVDDYLRSNACHVLRVLGGSAIEAGCAQKTRPQAKTDVLMGWQAVEPWKIMKNSLPEKKIYIIAGDVCSSSLSEIYNSTIVEQIELIIFPDLATCSIDSPLSAMLSIAIAEQLCDRIRNSSSSVTAWHDQVIKNVQAMNKDTVINLIQLTQPAQSYPKNCSQQKIWPYSGNYLLYNNVVYNLTAVAGLREAKLAISQNK